MKTLLIVGDAPVPAPLREVVERGSTSVVEKRPAEVVRNRPPDVDRIVLWAAAGDTDVANLARTYIGGSPERKDTVIFVSSDPNLRLHGMPAADVFVWPRDEDRLKMAFLTGA